MAGAKPKKRSRLARIRRLIRLVLAVWAVSSMAWLANSMRTRGVDPSLLESGAAVAVTDGPATLEFEPVLLDRGAGLVFFCGSGVTAEAYAPMLWPIADAGYPVFIVKLPYRFAPLETHRVEAIARAHRVMSEHQDIDRWVIAGHSLGGALAARIVGADQAGISGLVLIGTTHPKEDDLSFLQLPVTKVYATNDGVAPTRKVMDNKRLLPDGTKWVEIAGGNHSQFGHYGHQLFDGTAIISREEQQALTRAALLDALAAASGR